MTVSLEELEEESEALPTPETDEEKDEHDYAYSQLPSVHHFRLLKLFSRTSGGILTCSLHAFEIESPLRPQFEAISYTWDEFDPDNVCRVRVVAHETDGRSTTVGELRVRRNLHRLLKEVHSHAEDVWLWVDALCIDQSSRQERSQQVQLMGRIYSEAYAVIAWLDSEGNDDDAGAVFDDVYHEMLGKECREGVRDEDWDGLLAISALPYWGRKWVIQEIILARTVIVKCFGHTFPFAYLEDLAVWVRQHPDIHGQAALLRSPMIQVALHRYDGRLAHHAPQTLHGLLWRYRQHECSEPSDHVYALFNLVGEHRKHLVVNYERTSAQRYAATIKFLRDHDGMPPSEALSITYVLCRSFELWQNPLELPLAPGLPADAGSILVTAFDLGRAELLEESRLSIVSREDGRSLQQIPEWTLSRGAAWQWLIGNPGNFWNLTSAQNDGAGLPSRTSSRTMAYFRLPGMDMYGLASVGLKAGDRIWYFHNTLYAFVVRIIPDRDARLVGRACLFRQVNEYIINPPTDPGTQQHIVLGCDELPNMATWAMMRKDNDFEWLDTHAI